MCWHYRVYLKSVSRITFCVFLPSPVMSFLNSTASSAFHDLYSGTDFSSLNWLEQQWAAWYIWVGNPVVATGVLAFLVHEVSLSFWTRRCQLICPNSLFISVVVFRGSLLIQCHTSDDGSCNLTRCLRQKNSGLAPSRSYFRISP